MTTKRWPVPGSATGADVGRTLRAIEVGQHAIAVILAAAGAVRAIADGLSAWLAVLIAVVIVFAYGLGVLVADSGRERLAPVWFMVLVLVWVASVAVSDEFIWWAFVLWLLAGHVLRTGWALVVAIGVYGVTIAGPVVHHGTTTYATVIGPLIGGVFAFGIARGYVELIRRSHEREELVASLTQAQQEMADLHDELALTERHAGAIAERTRLARDIHDTVAQGLSSIRLLARAEVERDSTNADAADTADATGTSGRWRQVEGLAHDSLVDIRHIIDALTPTELEDRALATAIGRMLDRLAEQSNIVTDLEVDDTWPPLPPAAEVALLRTAQSALANVRLHAAASRVVVSLIDDGDDVRLDIVDDGRGFDRHGLDGHGAAASADHRGAGHGLAFMTSRLAELGGGLEVESAPGEGTAISAHVPVRAR